MGRPWNFPVSEEKASIRAPRRMGTRGAVRRTPRSGATCPPVPVSLHRLESSDVTSSHNKKNAFPAIARSPQVGRPYRFTWRFCSVSGIWPLPSFHSASLIAGFVTTGALPSWSRWLSHKDRTTSHLRQGGCFLGVSLVPASQEHPGTQVLCL